MRWRSGAAGLGVGFGGNQIANIRGCVSREYEEDRLDCSELHTASLPILYDQIMLVATFIYKIGDEITFD